MVLGHHLETEDTRSDRPGTRSVRSDRASRAGLACGVRQLFPILLSLVFCGAAGFACECVLEPSKRTQTLSVYGTFGYIMLHSSLKPPQCMQIPYMERMGRFLPVHSGKLNCIE